MAFGLIKGRIRPIYLYALTLFGSMLFFLIWEANEKYSISFEYVMLLLATGGLITLYEKILFAVKKKKNRKYKKVFHRTIAIFYAIGTIATVFAFVAGWKDCTEKKYVYQKDVVDLSSGKQNTTYDLSEHKVIEQTFQATAPFNRIDIYIKQQEEESEGEYRISILDGQGSVIRKTVINKQSTCLFNKKIKWAFSEIEPDHTMGDEYTIRIEKSKSGNGFLAFHYFSYLKEDKYESGTVKIDGEDLRTDLCFKVYDKCHDTYVSKSVYLLVVGFILLFELIVQKVRSHMCKL